ncbi:MAG: hypothetical protein Q8P20_04985 [bacterium]|nr:hypothetical protein [bacterium]
MADISQVKTTKIYKKIIIGFSLIVVITLALILYYSFSKTIITITLQPIEENTVFNVDIKETLTEEDQQSEYKLPGIFQNITIEKTKSFENTNTGEKADAQAMGTVTIYNKYSKDQPLAATTRLLTPEGKLFRIKDRVDVPAGSQIENVEVYADQSGAGGNIEATTFTIPGLWPGLQEQIYAESFTTMAGGVVDAAVLTQYLVTEAVAELKKEILEEAKQTFSESSEVKEAEFTKIGQALATITIDSNVEPAVGAIADNFEIYIKYNVFGIIFDEESLITIADNNLADKLPMDRIIDKTKNKEINYNPESQNFDDNTATLKVTYSAKTLLDQSSTIFDKEKLTDKNASELNRYFSSYDGILSVITQFSPIWVIKTPSLTDHIIVKIE